nr:immunoglobulin light chain junction region [Macaca mulatta]MOW57779.1 immunoglobulin light chain junction region [Macaca mulatta]
EYSCQSYDSSLRTYIF